MNIVPRTTSMSIPIVESTPVPQMGPMLYRPTPTPWVHDILEPVASEQAHARYLWEQMRHMKIVQLSPSDDRSLVSESLSREIWEYCSKMDEHHQYERETHKVMLDSMKEHKVRQRQQSKKERDEVYKQMTRNVEKSKSNC